MEGSAPGAIDLVPTLPRRLPRRPLYARRISIMLPAPDGSGGVCRPKGAAAAATGCGEVVRKVHWMFLQTTSQPGPPGGLARGEAEAHRPQRITITDTPNVNKMAQLTKLITMMGTFSQRIISISPR